MHIGQGRESNLQLLILLTYSGQIFVRNEEREFSPIEQYLTV